MIGIGTGIGFKHSTAFDWVGYWSTRYPSALALTVVSDTEIDLGWTNNGTTDYDGIKIYISTDGVNFTLKDTIAPANSYSATGLTATTYYYFKIRYYSGSNFSAYSNVAEDFTLIPQSKMLFWGLYSEISGGEMPNKVTGATDYLTVAGIAGSETYQTPNTAAYIVADTDYIWFKVDTTQRTPTTAELIGYDFPRTIIKYQDSSPYAIESIMILKSGETLTSDEENIMRDYFHLSVWWDNTLSAHGNVKGNRGVGQSVWPIEHVTEVVTYINGLTTPLSEGQLILLDTLVSDLKTGLSITNLSDAFDAIWVLAGETEESSLRNLVKDATHCTNVGSMPFVALEGFARDSGTKYLNTQFIPNTHGINFTQNDASLGVYIRTNVNENAQDIGVNSSAFSIKQSAIATRWGGASYFNMNNPGVSYVSNSQSDSRGIFITTRNGSAITNLYGYYNKSTYTSRTGTDATDGRATHSIFIGCYNNANTPTHLSTKQFSFAFVGKYITEGMRDVIVDAFEAYMDANGKGVI